MWEKKSILNLKEIKDISKKHLTPFIIYDEKAIKSNMEKLNKSFNKFTNFQNYFAVKACPNPTILNLLKELWNWADCSSMWELVMSEICWITWEDIMFTSNNTKAEEFKKAHSLWAIINFDDITHINFYKENVGEMPGIACCRYNPGDSKKGNSIIWNPEEAKYWMRKDQIVDAYKQLKQAWVSRFWLHTMVASNEIDSEYFIETARILFNLLIELEKELWISFEFVNLWWWIGIPYKPNENPVDLELFADGVKKEFENIIWKRDDLRIVMECGRMVTGPYGQLISKVQHVTEKYKNFVWLDASMSCLMRPGMYWAYHHISIIWKEDEKISKNYDITWSLCENIDKFAIDRWLPKIQEWDYLTIHDAWAHWIAMWFNYNAKLKPAELLLKEDWNIKLIRRKETLSDYFATINWIDLFEY